MKKLNTSPISGMQELIPQEQALFNKYKNIIQDVFLKHGFLNIETPVIDRAEILFAKAGGETEKQIYRVIKTDETKNEADEALRFDHTVPLARYTVEHENDLVFPFKVTQNGRNFRGERAQRGRFREFYQFDIDIIGREKLALEYDAEIILTLEETYRQLGLAKKLIRVSNRKILTGLLEELNLQEVSGDIFRIIDRSEKVTPEETRRGLGNLGIGTEKIEKVIAFTEISGNRNEVIRRLDGFGFGNEKFLGGVRELGQVLEIIENQGLSNDVIADMKIVRGLDYYTGTVFETVLPDYKEIGSIGGGGRYENLVGLYSDRVMPGVGGSIGLTRLFFIMRELGLVQNEVEAPVDVAIVPCSRAENDFSFALAKKIRNEFNKKVDLVLIDKKLRDKLAYAAKIAKYGIVIGGNETNGSEILVKDFTTGENQRLEDVFRLP